MLKIESKISINASVLTSDFLNRQSVENSLYTKSIWKYLISVPHISSFQLGQVFHRTKVLKFLVAHDILNFDLCHLFHPRDPSIICMHMKSQRFSTVSEHYSICGNGDVALELKLFQAYFSLNVSLMLIWENYRAPSKIIVIYYQSVRTISLDFVSCTILPWEQSTDLCTKQWYTFSGLIAEQMAVISFKLEKDFLCNFYCTIFGCNYGLLCTFFSFVCYNVFFFFFFKHFLIFSIHMSNMNWGIQL